MRKRAIRTLAVAFSCSVILTGVLQHNISSNGEYEYYSATSELPLKNGGKVISNAMTAPRPRDTLVHFDPFFMGGFRNQHMRFVAFVDFAVKHNISQILLPSLRWMDPYRKPNSIGHELLFDVNYWNSRAERVGLPTLVDYDPNVLEEIIPTSSNSESATVVPCWNETSSLYSGIDERAVRITNIRKVKVWSLIGQGELYTHCRRIPGKDNNPETIKEAARQDNASFTNRVYRYTHLIPHGGIVNAGGRLWWDYAALQDQRQKASDNVTINGTSVLIYPEHVPIEKAIYDLLRPSEHIVQAAEDAVKEVMQHANGTEPPLETKRPPRLLALHPRIEPEMLTHRCSKFMESNLTKVFERIQTFPSFHDSMNGRTHRFDLVFIAVSKEEIEKPVSWGGDLGDIMNQNRDALYRARSHGIFSSSGGASTNKTGIPIFESGADTAAKVHFPRPRIQSNQNASLFDSAESLGVKELVASIINFFTAVDADIFVGVRGSTYSTDVMSVRYYQHKDEEEGENYVVDPEGIQRLYGPAPPHACVGKI